jgi:IclR family acetate operon transcriptional repressor
MSKSPDPPKPTAKPRSGNVQSVERALSLLEVLGEDEEGFRLTDLAARTGLSPSTVHRLLTTLEQRRFVQFDPSESLWHVGRQAFTVGSAFVRQRNFVAPALPFLRRLRDQTRETANLGVIDDGQVVVLTQVESREIMRTITQVGGRVPMVTSGMGKAILATYEPADVSAIIASRGLRKKTPQSLVRTSDLRAELEMIRAQGYAVDNEEFMEGLRCIGAVVYNPQGEAQCAISVSGLSVRLTSERVREVGRILTNTARDLTLALGGKLPGES